MPLRTFTDMTGVEWQAWDVRPEAPYRAVIANAELERGWLVFQSPSEKRRLCPVPEDWESCPAERLYLLSRVARPAHTRAA